MGGSSAGVAYGLAILSSLFHTLLGREPGWGELSVAGAFRVAPHVSVTGVIGRRGTVLTLKARGATAGKLDAAMTDTPGEGKRSRLARRSGLRGRLVLSHLAVITVAMTLTGVGLLTLVRAYLLNALQDSLESQAELVAAALLSDAGVQVQPPASDPAYNTLQQQQIANLSVQIQNQTFITGGDDPALLGPESIRLTSELPTYVVVLNSLGDPVFESGLPGPPGLRHSAAAKSALAGSTGRTLLRGEDGDWMALALPLRREQELVGALVLAHPLGDVNAVLNDTLSRLFLAAGLAALLSGALGLILARRLVRPLSQLTAAARKLGQGDYEYPVPVGTRDEIAALSAAFESMREALQRTERTRAQFISDVSHELRTPLTGIKGLVETLQDGALEDPQVRDSFVASIGQETDRLIRLTQDLLTLTRADEHALELRLDRLDLAKLVRGMVDRLRPEAEKHRILLELFHLETDVIVHGDPDRLEQVMLNLLDNALKNSPPGSSVKVAVSTISTQELASLRQAQPKSGWSGILEGLAQHWAVVRVLDQGPGIPPALQERVFDRFFRADPSRDRDRGGSGLGLSIARALVEQHGGQIWIESPTPDWDGVSPPGTQASFVLPVV